MELEFENARLQEALAGKPDADVAKREATRASDAAVGQR